MTAERLVPKRSEIHHVKPIGQHELVKLNMNLDDILEREATPFNGQVDVGTFRMRLFGARTEERNAIDTRVILEHSSYPSENFVTESEPHGAYSRRNRSIRAFNRG